MQRLVPPELRGQPPHRYVSVRRWALGAFAAFLLASCAQPEPVTVVSASGVAASGAVSPLGGPIPLLPPGGISPASDGPISLGTRATPRPFVGPAEIERGTGRYVGADTSIGAARPPSITAGGPVTLDFVGIDAREVVRNVLGELLHVPYIIDPGVQGAVTLQTPQPVPRTNVIALLENALRLNGATLLVRNGTYVVLPIANAAREAPLGAGSGFVTRTVPAQFIAAADIARLLEPITPAGASIRADSARNLLIVSGPESLVADILGNIQVFDVDYLRGMSFALLPLRNAQAKTVAAEVTTMLGAGSSAIAGLVKVAPIERLNAILVTAIQPTYLDRVRAWVNRLDHGSGSATERRLYVYRVQNGRSGDLAAVLRKALGVETGSTGGSNLPPAGTASPLSDDIGSGGAASRGGFGGGSGRGLGSGQGDQFGGPSGQGSGGFAPNQGQGSPNPLLGGLPSPASVPEVGGGSPGGNSSGSPVSGVRVTADEVNNALVILASPQEYDIIEAALQRLDVMPVQVLIEATIAEVTLTNQLSLGLQYYIKSGNFQALFSSNTSSSTNSMFSGFNFVPGFDFGLSTAGGSSVILQALEQLTTVRVLSSPNLMVLNNQSARLQVGDQVPIATGSAVSTISSGAPIVNSIEYRDTGIILRVTPRVNASGLVLLDVSQEVSQVSSTTTSGLDSPTISQRRVTSSVAINDGETIALGGLISDSQNISKNGIPILQDIPGLGFLFGTRSNGRTRTELVALITPHVVRNRFEGRAVTDELRQKLPLLAPVPFSSPLRAR